MSQHIPSSSPRLSPPFPPHLRDALSCLFSLPFLLSERKVSIQRPAPPTSLTRLSSRLERSSYPSPTRTTLSGCSRRLRRFKLADAVDSKIEDPALVVMSGEVAKAAPGGTRCCTGFLATRAWLGPGGRGVSEACVAAGCFHPPPSVREGVPGPRLRMWSRDTFSVSRFEELLNFALCIIN